MSIFVTYDTEFLDDGVTTELISLAFVDECGKEYYAIVADADWDRVLAHPWLLANVVPRLPIHLLEGSNGWRFDSSASDFACVKSRAQIAAEVSKFLLDRGGADEVDLWAYYPATDHVALYQLFGDMSVCTDYGMPMRTSCLKQEEESLNRHIRRGLSTSIGSEAALLCDNLFESWTRPRPTQHTSTEHHALFDARHDMELARWLMLLS